MCENSLTIASPKSRAFEAACGRAFHLPEALEEFFDFAFGNADARVGDRQRQAVAAPGDVHIDAVSRWRNFTALDIRLKKIFS